MVQTPDYADAYALHWNLHRVVGGGGGGGAARRGGWRLEHGTAFSDVFVNIRDMCERVSIMRRDETAMHRSAGELCTDFK